MIRLEFALVTQNLQFSVNKGIRQLFITIGNVNEWMLLSTFTYIPLFTRDFPSFTAVNEVKS